MVKEREYPALQDLGYYQAQPLFGRTGIPMLSVVTVLGLNTLITIYSTTSKTVFSIRQRFTHFSSLPTLMISMFRREQDKV